MSKVSAVERALQLARTGTVRSGNDIRRTLDREGAEGASAHLDSRTFKKQLRDAIAARLLAEQG